MATGAAIVGGAKLVGGVVGAISSSGDASDAQSDRNQSMNMGMAAMQDYMNQAGQYGQDALEYSQGLMTSWEETFGGIEQNLSDYYANLDPVKYAENYKSDLNANIDKQLTQMNETMSSNGLQTSGMQQQTAKEAAFAKATGGAQADLMAEDKVMGMKTDFLNRGENRKAMYDNALTGVSSTSSGSSSQNSFNNSFNNAIGGSESQGSSTNSNYQPIGDLANIGVKEGNQHAGDSAGWMKGGIDNIGSGIGGLLK